MYKLWLLLLLAVPACTPQPLPLLMPPDDAPEWDLNVGRWPGSNDLTKPPQVTSRGAN